MRRADFDRRTLDILGECDVSPDRFELELTETAMMHNVERASDTLLSLNRASVLLTIDDFGTGYPSPSYLKRFAIDKLKIDHSCRIFPAIPTMPPLPQPSSPWATF